MTFSHAKSESSSPELILPQARLALLLSEESQTKENVEQFLKSRNNDIAPQVYLLTDLKLVDYSSLTSNSSIIDAITQEFKESKKVIAIMEV